MKAFIALCFLAVAFAEPEAKADPYLAYAGLGGYGYQYAPYTTYNAAYPRYTVGAYPSVYSSAYAPYALGGYGRLFKREAEAEAEADPLTVYSSAYPYAYQTPSVYTYGVNPYVYKAPLAYAGFPVAQVTQANGAVSSTVGLNGFKYPGAYANAGSYVANSAGTVHVAKREAEANADPAFVYGSTYPNVYSYGFQRYVQPNFYNSYLQTGYPYAATYSSYGYNTPYVYGK